MLTPLEEFETEDSRVTFLEATVELIDHVIETRWLLSYAKMQEPLERAWEEAHERYREERGRIHEMITYGEELDQHGLRGQQWEAKFTGFSWAYRRLRLRLRGSIWALKGVLKWANKILASMSAALPSLGFLKEMKDMAEAVMDDTLDPAGHWV